MTSYGVERVVARFYKKQSTTNFEISGDNVVVYLPKEQMVYPKGFSGINRDFIFLNPSESFSGLLIDARTGGEREVMFIGNKEKLTLHHLKGGVKTEIDFHSKFYESSSISEFREKNSTLSQGHFLKTKKPESH